MSKEESRRVVAGICKELTEMFEEYIAENIGEDILAQYHDGFTVAQVAADLSEGINQFAKESSKLKYLTQLITVCADDYLEEVGDV